MTCIPAKPEKKMQKNNHSETRVIIDYKMIALKHMKLKMPNASSPVPYPMWLTSAYRTLKNAAGEN